MSVQYFRIKILKPLARSATIVILFTNHTNFRELLTHKIRCDDIDGHDKVDSTASEYA